ncbi:centrosome-associated protein 350 isoform X1 [Misgurnus anguillicaudatus]|uniref:centrosome-associated protein 350 isoform X1 n=2 Tax=Misgurnus anguillicaudatus TaxID=75329 RepID=UPI003CCF9AEC
MPVMNRSGLLSKAGLRRLLQSDEVWTLARKRNQVELVPGEQDILQFTESNNPPTSPSHRYARQSTQAPIRLINPERKGACPPCQRDPVKTSKVGPDVNDQDAQKKVPGFYEDTRTSKSIESCRGERFQYPAEENLKPVLNKQQFTHDHKPNQDSDIRFHTGSNVSSDTPQDLRSHSDESHLKPKDRENIKMRTLVHGTETTALNVKNNQRSKNVLLLNNNHDICNEDSKLQWKSSASYHKSDRDCKFPETSTVADAPLIGSLILNTLSADTRNAEDSPYKIDEKVFSHHSESLTCSEKKKDHLKEKNTDTSTFSVVYAEKYTVVPEVSQFELDFNNKDGDGCNSGRTIAESLLSEILSPVDEVLSYGSAELPSVKGGAESGLYSYSGPPHPAFEIITWTSEEELPAPPESPEDLSINSENVPPLPVDLRRKESHRLGSLRDEEIANGDLSTSLPPSVCEDDCSEYTSSLPEDVKHEISDPLSSFQIGDRVLVCNSRPGVLKYKGLTAFADGFWAGVALDTPNGNHNGTFRGVKYFSCDKSHGVLVRAEDVSHIHREHGTYIETVVDEDPFSDEEPPRHEPKKDTSSSAGAQGGDTNMKDDPKSTHQKKSQEDISNGAKNLLYTSKIALPKIDTELIHHNKENRHLVDDSDHSVTRLTDESREDIIRCTEDIRRRRRRTKSMHDNTHINTQDARKNEDSFLTPRLLEQWHQAPPDMPLKIKVQPHDDPVVYRLVDAAVDILCGQANEEALDGCETPNYLLDDKSCKAYRQVIFQLTSDVLQDILGDLLGTKQSYHNICNESVISALPSSNISITLLKAAVKKEIQKTLNLERNEQHMTEMLQKLCKYWYAKRDRVDYILIQELHNDERTWQDYTADQYTVKMRLTEEIFSILLDDTIVTLNHMHY